jgi:hypothetical protein
VRDLGAYLVDWFQEHGIDPLVASGVIGASLVFFQRNNIRNLRSLEPHDRRFTIAQTVGGVFLMIIGALSAVGVLPDK